MKQLLEARVRGHPGWLKECSCTSLRSAAGPGAQRPPQAQLPSPGLGPAPWGLHQVPQRRAPPAAPAQPRWDRHGPGTAPGPPRPMPAAPRWIPARPGPAGARQPGAGPAPLTPLRKGGPGAAVV